MVIDTEFMKSLVGKEICIIFESGDDITGDLERATDEYAIIRSGINRGIVYLATAEMVLEGPVKW
jgi:hypothetical protein